MSKHPKPTEELAMSLAALFADPRMTIQRACLSVGIGRATFYKWMAQADQGDPECMNWARIVAEARDAQAEELERFGTDAALIGNRAGVSWAQWMLETKHRSEYGREVRKLELTGRDGGPVRTEGKHELPALTPEKANAIREQVLFGDRTEDDGND